MSHRTIYAIVGAVLAVLLVVMVVTFDYSKQNAEADRKADQLIAIYEKLDLPVPADRNQIARVLGDDAAVVCEPLANGADLGALKSRLGVGGEFYFRSTEVDARTLVGLTSIVTVYCPDELPDLKDFLDGFSLEEKIIDYGTKTN